VPWRSSSLRAVAGRRAPAGAPILLGALFSVGVIGVMAIALSAVRGVGAEPPPRTPSVAATMPSVITQPQTTGVAFIRAVARRQLSSADRALDRCRRDRAAQPTRRTLSVWRACLKWPLAHLAVGARTNAAILSGLSNQLPQGKCRGLVLGMSNTSTILGGLVDELLRGLFNTGPAARSLSTQRYASVRGLIGTVRGMIRSPGWVACRPTGARPRIS